MIVETNHTGGTSDAESFAVIYDRLHPLIFGYVFRRVGDYDRTCDIVSETFLKAYLKKTTFRAQNGVIIDAWIYRIATNEIAQFFRKRQYEPTSLTQLVELNGYEPVALETLEAERAEAERQLRQNDEFLVVQQRLLTMPLAYQEVLSLRYFEQKSIADIALITKKPLGTVKSLLSRGVEKLRNLLETHGPR